MLINPRLHTNTLSDAQTNLVKITCFAPCPARSFFGCYERLDILQPMTSFAPELCFSHTNKHWNRYFQLDVKKHLFMTEEINYWNVHEITLQPPLEEEVLEISVMQWMFKSTTHLLERKFEMKIWLWNNWLRQHTVVSRNLSFTCNVISCKSGSRFFKSLLFCVQRQKQ